MKKSKTTVSDNGLSAKIETEGGTINLTSKNAGTAKASHEITVITGISEVSFVPGGMSLRGTALDENGKEFHFERVEPHITDKVPPTPNIAYLGPKNKPLVDLAIKAIAAGAQGVFIENPVEFHETSRLAYTIELPSDLKGKIAAIGVGDVQLEHLPKMDFVAPTQKGTVMFENCYVSGIKTASSVDALTQEINITYRKIKLVTPTWPKRSKGAKRGFIQLRKR